MKRSNRLVLLVGIFLAVVAFVGIYLLFSGGSGPVPGASPSPPTTAKVVVAKVDIPLGTQVTADMIDLKEVPIADSISSFTNQGLVISKTIRKTAFAGTQLTFDYFIDTGVANDVTSNLPAGTRGIAVQVDQVSGVGTLVHTGDWVDVVISVKIQQVVPNPSAKSVINVGAPQGFRQSARAADDVWLQREQPATAGEGRSREYHDVSARQYESGDRSD